MTTILYIEDNPLNLRLVRKMLATAGYQMLEAVDGLTGVAIAAREHPDLILVDINLPGADGFEVTAQLKASSEMAHIPVIALTANCMHGDREQCIAAGCDGYLAKPVTRIELLNIVGHFVMESQVQYSLAAG